jgi:hypothetical protein
VVVVVMRCGDMCDTMWSAERPKGPPRAVYISRNRGIVTSCGGMHENKPQQEQQCHRNVVAEEAERFRGNKRLHGDDPGVLQCVCEV